MSGDVWRPLPSVLLPQFTGEETKVRMARIQRLKATWGVYGWYLKPVLSDSQAHVLLHLPRKVNLWCVLMHLLVLSEISSKSGNSSECYHGEKHVGWASCHGTWGVGTHEWEASFSSVYKCLIYHV